VVRGGEGWSLTDSEYVSPLLDGLIPVVEVKGIIVGSVPQLNLRALSAVAWICGTDLVTPLSSSFRELALSTLGVPHTTSGETTERNTRPGGPSSENIRIGAHQHVGHHRSGTDTDGEDTGGIGLVGADSVLDHVDDGQGISTAVVSESCRGVNIPASTDIRGIGVNDDEPVLVSI